MQKIEVTGASGLTSLFYTKGVFVWYVWLLNSGIHPTPSNQHELHYRSSERSHTKVLLSECHNIKYANVMS